MVVKKSSKILVLLHKMTTRGTRNKLPTLAESINTSVDEWKRLGKKALILKCGELHLAVNGRVEELANRVFDYYQEYQDFQYAEESEKAESIVSEPYTVLPGTNFLDSHPLENEDLPNNFNVCTDVNVSEGPFGRPEGRVPPPGFEWLKDFVMGAIQAEREKTQADVLLGKVDTAMPVSVAPVITPQITAETAPVVIASRSSRSLPPLTGKMKEKIKKGEFVDFHRIYAILTNTYEESQTSLSYTFAVRDNFKEDIPKIEVGPSEKSKIKVVDLMSWLLAWTAFFEMSVCYHPHLVQDMLRHQANISAYATQYQVTAWLQYDVAFRTMIATNQGASWADENSRLFNLYLRGREKSVTTYAGKKNGGKYCTACKKYGHSDAFCFSRSNAMLPSKKRAISTDGNSARGSTSTGVDVCFQFNKFGKCDRFPCRFSHTCSKCEGDHPVTRCLERR